MHLLYSIVYRYLKTQVHLDKGALNLIGLLSRRQQFAVVKSPEHYAFTGFLGSLYVVRFELDASSCFGNKLTLWSMLYPGVWNLVNSESRGMGLLQIGVDIQPLG